MLASCATLVFQSPTLRECSSREAGARSRVQAACARGLYRYCFTSAFRPARFRDLLRDDRADHDERPQRPHAVAGGEGDLPVAFLTPVGQVGALSACCRTPTKAAAAGVARDRDGFRRETHLLRVRGPADSRSASSFSARTTRHVLPKLPCWSGGGGSPRRCAGRAARSADGGVGLDAVAQRALLVVEAQLLDDRPVQDDQRLGARRLAAVLDPVSGRPSPPPAPPGSACTPAGTRPSHR